MRLRVNRLTHMESSGDKEVRKPEIHEKMNLRHPSLKNYLGNRWIHSRRMFSQVFFLNHPESILMEVPTHIKLVKVTNLGFLLVVCRCAENKGFSIKLMDYCGWSTLIFIVINFYWDNLEKRLTRALIRLKIWKKCMIKIFLGEGQSRLVFYFLRLFSPNVLFEWKLQQFQITLGWEPSPHWENVT